MLSLLFTPRVMGRPTNLVLSRKLEIDNKIETILTEKLYKLRILFWKTDFALLENVKKVPKFTVYPPFVLQKILPVVIPNTYR